MQSNEYLYGKDIVVVKVPQFVIDERVALLKENLAKLMDHSYYTRDGVKVNKVLDAIKFWEKINDRDKQ